MLTKCYQENKRKGQIFWLQKINTTPWLLKSQRWMFTNSISSELTSGRQKTHLQIWHGICSPVWESGHIGDNLEQSPSQPMLAEWFDDPVTTDSILRACDDIKTYIISFCH